MARRRFADWPLRWKMLALLVAASALPLAMMAAIAFTSTSKILRTSTTRLLDTRTMELARELDSFHQSFLSQSSRLAQLPSLNQTLSGSPAQRAALRPRLEKVLAVFANGDDRVRGVVLLDASGTVIAATEPPQIGRTHYPALLRGSDGRQAIHLRRVRGHSRGQFRRHHRLRGSGARRIAARRRGRCHLRPCRRFLVAGRIGERPGRRRQLLGRVRSWPRFRWWR